MFELAIPNVVETLAKHFPPQVVLVSFVRVGNTDQNCYFQMIINAS
jgi:hypothetical protein